MQKVDASAQEVGVSGHNLNRLWLKWRPDGSERVQWELAMRGGLSGARARHCRP